jgi:hypothetical protein
VKVIDHLQMAKMVIGLHLQVMAKDIDLHLDYNKEKTERLSR